MPDNTTETPDKPLTPCQTQKKIRNAIIANQVGSGQDVKDVANQHNLSIPQTYRILSDNQCQQILDQVMRVNIAHAKGINKRFLKHCYDTEDKKISLDAIKQYQKIVGIAPSHAVSLFIQNIYNDNRAIVTEDVAALFELLSEQAAGGGDVFDVEVILGPG